MLGKKNQLWNEAFPSKAQITKAAKADRVNKEAFVQSERHKIWRTAFILNLFKIAGAVFKRNTADIYMAILRLNSEIQQVQDDFEMAVIGAVKTMRDAKEEMQGAGNLNLRRIYNGAKHQYEVCRGNAKKTLSQKKSEAELKRKQMENYADTLMSDCESAIALYWKIAREKFKRLGATPPSVRDLMEIADVSFYVPEIDRTELSDTAEYLRLEDNYNLAPIPRHLIDFNTPQMMVANDENTNSEEEV